MQISKLNEVYLKLEIDSSLSKELANYFTFEVPGAKFMPAFRNRIWDGKIRLFSEQTGKIYVGLLPYIKQYCKKNNITFVQLISPTTTLKRMREIIKNSDELNYFISMLSTTGGRLKSSSSKILKQYQSVLSLRISDLT